MPGLIKRRKKLGSRVNLSEAKLSKPKPMEGEDSMAPEKELADEGEMTRRSKQVVLSSLRKADSFRLFGKEFRVDVVEGDKVTVRNLETQDVRSFKPSLKVMPA